MKKIIKYNSCIVRKTNLLNGAGRLCLNGRRRKNTKGLTHHEDYQTGMHTVHQALQEPPARRHTDEARAEAPAAGAARAAAENPHRRGHRRHRGRRHGLAGLRRGHGGLHHRLPQGGRPGAAARRRPHEHRAAGGQDGPGGQVQPAGNGHRGLRSARHRRQGAEHAGLQPAAVAPSTRARWA